MLKKTALGICQCLRSKHQIQLSEATFLGLCAYLHSLVRWGYHIPTSAYDAFVCCHSRFVTELASNHTEIPAYHFWFTEQKLHLDRKGSVLDEQTLIEIASEHPYTFVYTEACLDIIAKKRRKAASERRTRLQLKRLSWQLTFTSAP